LQSDSADESETSSQASSLVLFSDSGSLMILLVRADGTPLAEASISLLELAELLQGDGLTSPSSTIQ
jgi:hypothetical protein